MAITVANSSFWRGFARFYPSPTIFFLSVSVSVFRILETEILSFAYADAVPEPWLLTPRRLVSCTALKDGPGGGILPEISGPKQLG